MIWMLSHAQIDPKKILSQKKKSIFFEKKKSIFFRKIWIWDFSAKPLHLKMRTFFSLNDHTWKWGLQTATQLPGASRASRSIQARLGASSNIWKHTEALGNFLKSWKNMKNHEKSWKIMISCAERLLPNSFQEPYRKPRKLKSHLRTYLKVVEMVFLPPQNILEWLRYPPGRFNNVFA